MNALGVDYFLLFCLFFFNDTATTEIYTLSLHDALPIWGRLYDGSRAPERAAPSPKGAPPDRKSTRLNSSHPSISYAVFCLKKNKTKRIQVLVDEEVTQRRRRDVHVGNALASRLDPRLLVEGSVDSIRFFF